MESREQRIVTLATTLKTSGIAKSDAQARMMAEDMVGVEEHVQRNYEEKHAAANEYLQTAKNLGVPRSRKIEPVSVVRPETRPEGSRMIEPIPTKSSSVKQSELPLVHTDVKFGGKTLNQAFDHDKTTHDTHNAALEAIKAQISAKSVDTVLDDIDDTTNHLSNDDTSNTTTTTSNNLTSDSSVVKKEVIMQDIDDMIEAPEAPKGVVDDAIAEVVDEVKDEVQVSNQENVSDVLVEPSVESPKLDAQRLVELMEEDGKLEEHTREIKEKPKDVKPKEAYAENNIDLSNVFNFGKR